MNKNSDQFEPDDAQQTLDSIRSFQRAGLLRGMPPLWFGMLMAILGGISITVAGLKLSVPLSLSLFVVMAILVSYQVFKADVKMKPLLSTRVFLLAIIGVGVICMPLILIAQANLDTYGRWVAWISGIGFAIACSIAVLFERSRYLARLDAETC